MDSVAFTLHDQVLAKSAVISLHCPHGRSTDDASSAAGGLDSMATDANTVRGVAVVDHFGDIAMRGQLSRPPSYGLTLQLPTGC